MCMKKNNNRLLRGVAAVLCLALMFLTMSGMAMATGEPDAADSAPEITDAVIDAIAEMSPLRVVFRDSSFEEASQKMNLFEIFKQKCGWSDYEVKNNVKVI